LKTHRVEAPTFSLDSQLTDGGKVVSLICLLVFNPQEDSWYSFLLEAESTPAGRIRSTEKRIHLIEIQTHDLLACRIVAQPRAPINIRVQ
jgi:hypothetical protein